MGVRSAKRGNHRATDGKPDDQSRNGIAGKPQIGGAREAPDYRWLSWLQCNFENLERGSARCERRRRMVLLADGSASGRDDHVGDVGEGGETEGHCLGVVGDRPSVYRVETRSTRESQQHRPIRVENGGFPEGLGRLPKFVAGRSDGNSRLVKYLYVCKALSGEKREVTGVEALPDLKQRLAFGDVFATAPDIASLSNRPIDPHA